MSDKNPEQALCKACGFCCDDTLFPHATVEKDEVPPPGFAEVVEDGKRYFALPCSHFDGMCTIYHKQRGRICVTFQCSVLADAIEEEISFAEAADLVAKVQSQKARINRLLTDCPGETIRDRYAEFERRHADRKDTIEFKRQHKDLLIEWVVFKSRLERFSPD